MGCVRRRQDRALQPLAPSAQLEQPITRLPNRDTIDGLSRGLGVAALVVLDAYLASHAVRAPPQALADAVRWTCHPGEVADVLRVDLVTLHARLESLTDDERAVLDEASGEHAA